MKNAFRSQRGQEIVLVALLLPILIAALGLVVDVGLVFVHQRRVQNAADAAAAAAGMVLYNPNAAAGRAAAIQAAGYYADQNGYEDNGSTTRVFVNQPPSSGVYANNSRYIQVQIEEAVQPIFARVLWNGTFRVRAAATAGYVLKPLGADLYVLKDSEPCGYRSLDMNGNPGKIRAVNGIVQVNSPCANAVDVGNGDIEAGAINITGPSYAHGSNGHLIPEPTLGAPPIPDPLASLPEPSTAGCLTRTIRIDGKWLPGIYPNDFEPKDGDIFDGSGGQCNSVFYFMGPLKVKKEIRVSNGMFYFATDGMELQGGATFDGTAPTSGPYAGMLIFMARNNTHTLELHGNPSTNCDKVKGIVYVPAGNIQLKGTSDQCYAGALVTWTIDSIGTSTTTLIAYPDQKPGTTVTDSQVE